MAETFRYIAFPAGAEDANAHLKDVLAVWRADSEPIERVADVMAPLAKELEAESWDEVMRFAMLMKHMEKGRGKELRHGKVLWHAAPPDVNIGAYRRPILTTFRTREAAEAYARGHYYTREGFVVHEIRVATTLALCIDVKAFPDDDDPRNANDREILVRLIGLCLVAHLLPGSRETVWMLAVQ